MKYKLTSCKQVTAAGAAGDPTLLMSHEPDPRYGVWWLYGGREVAVVGASHRTVVCCGW